MLELSYKKTIMSRQKMNQSLIEILYIILYFLYIIFYTCNFNGDGNKTLSFDKYLQMVLRKINPEKIHLIESPRKNPPPPKNIISENCSLGKKIPWEEILLGTLPSSFPLLPLQNIPHPNFFPFWFCDFLSCFWFCFMWYSNFLFDFTKNDKQTFLVKYKLFCCVPRCV